MAVNDDGRKVTNVSRQTDTGIVLTSINETD